MPRGRISRSRPERRHATVAMAVSLISLLLGALPADSARAGTYVMRNCSVPGFAAAPMGPWQADSWSGLYVADTCRSGDGVGFTFVGAHSLLPGYVARLAFFMPRTGPQQDISLEKVSLWYAARLQGSGQYASLLSLAGGREAQLNERTVITGPPGGENLTFGAQFKSGDILTYNLYLTCGWYGSMDVGAEPCVTEHAVPLLVRGMEVTLSEQLAPTVASPGGTLLSGGPQQGIGTVSFVASDPQSGLAKVEVLLGDTVVETQDLTPRCLYSDFTVCPAFDDEALEVDTRAVPNGSYDLAVRVTDAAGNAQVVQGGGSVEIANGTLALRRFAIAANFKGSKLSMLTVPYGRRVSLRGRLTQGAQALVGSPVAVLERLDQRGAREKTTRTVTTRADGSFSIGLATSRPSRYVRLAYRPAGGAQVVSRKLRLRVAAGARVRASLRGRLVRFSGQVLGRPFPKRGKRIQMEGRSPGSAWTAFKILRTDKQGRFSGTYRLRVRRPGVALKIRALVPSEAGYGYVASRSRAVTLRVR